MTSATAYIVDQIFKTVLTTIAKDLSTSMKVAASIPPIPINLLMAFVKDLNTFSEQRLEKSKDKEDLFREFVSYKDQFSKSTNPNLRCIYYYLCSFNALPSNQREQCTYEMTKIIGVGLLMQNQDEYFAAISRSLQEMNQNSVMKMIEKRNNLLER